MEDNTMQTQPPTAGARLRRALDPRRARDQLAAFRRLRRSARARSRHRDQLFVIGLILAVFASALTHSPTLALVTLGVAIGGCRTSVYSFNGPLLGVAYRGSPVTVDLSRLSYQMSVPMRDDRGRRTDPDAGAISAALFTCALNAGAIIAPAGMRLECHADDDWIGGGFILIAFLEDDDSTVGVTTGWQDATKISAPAGQHPCDPALVGEALKFMAHELNTALQWR
jgi:hypothetical protein